MIIQILYIILTNYQITVQALNVIVKKNQQNRFVANISYTNLTAQPNFDMDDPIVFCGKMEDNSDYQYHFTYLFLRLGYYLNIVEGDCSFEQAYYPQEGCI